MTLLQRSGQVFVSLVVLLLVAMGGIYAWSGARMGRAYEVAPVPVPVADDSATLARGEHVAAIRGCADCHGEDMGGGVFLDEMPVARLPASNLTSGAGGVASRYRTDADWVRAIRDGVDPPRGARSSSCPPTSIAPWAPGTWGPWSAG